MMAVKFRSRWPVAAAGVSDVDDQDNRQAWLAYEELRGVGVVVTWANTGDTSGLHLFGGEAIAVGVMASDALESGAFSQLGCYGPIVYQGGTSQADLYMHRTEWDPGGIGFWKTGIYAGAPDGTGVVQGGGAGRLFFVYAIAAD